MELGAEARIFLGALFGQHENRVDAVEETLFLLAATFCSNHFPEQWHVPSYDTWYRQANEVPSYMWLADAHRLIGADMGPQASMKIVKALRSQRHDKDITGDELRMMLANEIERERTLDQAAAEHPGVPVVLLGHSMGGAVALAAETRDREVVFLGVGFETTAPAIAGAIRTAAQRRVAGAEGHRAGAVDDLGGGVEQVEDAPGFHLRDARSGVAHPDVTVRNGNDLEGFLRQAIQGRTGPRSA